jgi:hypothetical protein
LSSLALLRDKPIYLPTAEGPLEVLSFVAHDHGWICYVEQLRWLSGFFTTSKVREPRTKQSLGTETENTTLN